MTTAAVPRLVPPGLRLSDLKPGDDFAVRLSGNSMEPDYRDGDAVILSVVGTEDAAAIIGRDCMFWRLDGQGCFKRLEAMTGDGTLILRALNQAAFPEPFRVKRAALKMLAFARYVYREASRDDTHKEKSGQSEPSKAATPASKSSKRKSILTAA